MNFDFAKMAGIRMVAGPIILVMVLMPIAIYVVARWRLYRDEGAPDPQLGLKVAICWFKFAAFQMLLAATFLLLYALISDLPEATEYLMRLGAGLTLPSLLLFAVQYFILKQTNAEQRPTVSRMFVGVSLAYTGGIAFCALMVGGVMLFQEDSSSPFSRAVMVAIVVYGGTSLIQGIRLMRQITGAFMPTATASIGTPS